MYEVKNKRNVTMTENRIKMAISAIDTETLKQIVLTMSLFFKKMEDKSAGSHLLFYTNRYLNFGTEPNEDAMSEAERNQWELIKPYLDEIRGRE